MSEVPLYGHSRSTGTPNNPPLYHTVGHEVILVRRTTRNRIGYPLGRRHVLVDFIDYKTSLTTHLDPLREFEGI